jgi:hypothetical protein
MIHPPDCECEAYACELRRKGIGFGYDATPTHRARRPWRPKVNCSWEAGVAGEHRRGGFFQPYVSEHSLRPVRMKEASERRREISEIRRSRVQGPALQE